MTEVKKRSPLNTLWGFLKTHKVLIAVMFASELLISAVSVSKLRDRRIYRKKHRRRDWLVYSRLFGAYSRFDRSAIYRNAVGYEP